MCMPGGSGSSGVRGCFLNTHPCLLARPGAVCPPEMLAREEEEAAVAGGRKRPPPAATPGALHHKARGISSAGRLCLPGPPGS